MKTLSLRRVHPIWRKYRNWFTPGFGDIHICCFQLITWLNARSQTKWAIEDQVENLNTHIQMYLQIHICISHVVAPICDLGIRTFEMIIDSKDPCHISWRLKPVPPRTSHWRLNGHDDASNYQPHHCLLNRLFRRRSKKTSKIRVTGLCEGNQRGPVNSPHKGPVTRKMFPFDDVIMKSGTPTIASICKAWTLKVHINMYVYMV